MGRGSASASASEAEPKAKDPPCLWHSSPDGWRVVCAIISQLQMLTATVAAVWHCLPAAPMASVTMLNNQFFLHLRVVQRVRRVGDGGDGAEGDDHGPMGKMRVLFTDAIKSFGMGNTGWKVHLEHRFPGARKIRVQDGDKGHNEYVSLSLADFARFVLWSDQPLAPGARETTFQMGEPRHHAARAFMKQAAALLSAFIELPLPPSGSPSLSDFLLSHQWIHKAAFANGRLRGVNEDGSAGAPLALTDFQKHMQLTVPEEKKQQQIDKKKTEQINKQRKADGLGPLRDRKPKVKAVQVGPQIGNKKRGSGKQRDRALAAAKAKKQKQPQHQLHDHPLVVSSSPGEESADDDEDDAFDGEDDVDDGNDSFFAGDEEEDGEEIGVGTTAHDEQWQELVQETDMILDHADSQQPDICLPDLPIARELSASPLIHSAHQQQHQFQHPEQMGQQQQQQQHQHPEQMGQQQHPYPLLQSIGDHLQPSASARSSPSSLHSAGHAHASLQVDLSATRFNSPPSPFGIPSSPFEFAHGTATALRPHANHACFDPYYTFDDADGDVFDGLLRPAPCAHGAVPTAVR